MLARANAGEIAAEAQPGQHGVGWTRTTTGPRVAAAGHRQIGEARERHDKLDDGDVLGAGQQMTPVGQSLADEPVVCLDALRRPVASEVVVFAVEDVAGLEGLAAAIKVFRELDAEMPAQTILTFLLVAQNPGIKVGELVTRLDIAQSSTSRNVAYLSKWRAFEEEGHDLIEAVEDPKDRRTKVVNLTAKGKRLAEKVARVVG